jgi:hypothetical protein
MFIFLWLDLQITLSANCGVAALGCVGFRIVHEADGTLTVRFGDT